MRLVVVQRQEGRQGFVLLPKRWMVERSFAWVSRFRRLALKHRIDEICTQYPFYGSDASRRSCATPAGHAPPGLAGLPELTN
jgi:transposase